MSNESDDKNLVIVGDSSNGLARWAPMAVVFCVIGGFVVLSWYAYHVGTQSVKDEDLLVVEADKTPIKEKPVDPGGMKFPNQDKTIFNTFSNAQQQPLKVERVLPKPEEPMSKDEDMSNTSTWINDKLQKNNDEPAGKEKVIGDEDKKPEPVKPVVSASKMASQVPDNSKIEHQVIAAEPTDDGTYVAHKSPEKKALATTMVADASAVQKPAKPEPAAKPVEKPKEAKKDAPVAVSSDEFVVQLGAYRSEQEATDAWGKMHLKQKELSDKDPLIVKADLGSKGIYYRLRVGGFSNSADAKEFCSTLSDKGQACIIPVGK